MKRKLLAQCLKIALKFNTPDKHPQFNNYKHISFIIQDNKIIEYSTNYAAEPFNKFYQSWLKLHAEANAYKRAKGIIKHNKPLTIVNIRLDKKGNLKNSKPCLCCLNYINIVTNNNASFFYSNEIGGFSKIIQ